MPVSFPWAGQEPEHLIPETNNVPQNQDPSTMTPAEVQPSGGVQPQIHLFNTFPNHFCDAECNTTCPVPQFPHLLYDGSWQGDQKG